MLVLGEIIHEPMGLIGLDNSGSEGVHEEAPAL